MDLDKNIRTFRKQRSLTQEQLAEVLGVTVGAVYKWEAGLSIPELNMILEMADFFDASVDVLLGYKMRDNRLAATSQRLRNALHEHDRTGLAEAEKALRKYPHSFEIVYEAADLYRIFGLTEQTEHNKELFRRALELLENALVLLPQNKDPLIGEHTLYGHMADAYLGMGQRERAIELLKAHNVNGSYNDRIGLTLSSDLEHAEEAMSILSEALVRNLTSLIHIVIGMVNVYDRRRDYAAATGLLTWIIQVLSGLKTPGKQSFLDKTTAFFLACLSCVEYKTGDREAARRSLHQAKETAERFDAAPDYAVSAVRFVEGQEQKSAYDDVGDTAMAAIENILRSAGDDGLEALWREVCSQKT